jgi:hypothetical protein
MVAAALAEPCKRGVIIDAVNGATCAVRARSRAPIPLKKSWSVSHLLFASHADSLRTLFDMKVELNVESRAVVRSFHVLLPFVWDC